MMSVNLVTFWWEMLQRRKKKFGGEARDRRRGRIPSLVNCLLAEDPGHAIRVPAKRRHRDPMGVVRLGRSTEMLA